MTAVDVPSCSTSTVFPSTTPTTVDGVVAGGRGSAAAAALQPVAVAATRRPRRATSDGAWERMPATSAVRRAQLTADRPVPPSGARMAGERAATAALRAAHAGDRRGQSGAGRQRVHAHQGVGAEVAVQVHQIGQQVRVRDGHRGVEQRLRTVGHQVRHRRAELVGGRDAEAHGARPRPAQAAPDRARDRSRAGRGSPSAPAASSPADASSESRSARTTHPSAGSSDPGCHEASTSSARKPPLTEKASRMSAARSSADIPRRGWRRVEPAEPQEQDRVIMSTRVQPTTDTRRCTRRGTRHRTPNASITSWLTRLPRSSQAPTRSETDAAFRRGTDRSAVQPSPRRSGRTRTEDHVAPSS